MGFYTVLKPLIIFSNICGLGPSGEVFNKFCCSYYPFLVLFILLMLQTFILLDMSGTTAKADSPFADLLDTYGFAVTCFGSFLVHTFLSKDIYQLFCRLLYMHQHIKSSSKSILLHITGGVIYEITFAFLSVAVNPFEYTSWFFYVVETLTYVALEITSFAIFLQFTQAVLACHKLFTALNYRLSWLLSHIHNVSKHNKARYIFALRNASMEYSEIVNICHEVNALFGMLNLFSVLLIFLQLSYATYNGISDWQGLIVDTALWAGYFIYKLLVTLSACSTTIHSAKETARLMNRFSYECDDKALSNEVEQFSLQLLHETTYFDALGFFSLDFTLLYSMIAAVTGYLIILVQFTKK